MWIRKGVNDFLAAHVVMMFLEMAVLGLDRKLEEHHGVGHITIGRELLLVEGLVTK